MHSIVDRKPSLHAGKAVFPYTVASSSLDHWQESPQENLTQSNFDGILSKLATMHPEMNLPDGSLRIPDPTVFGSASAYLVTSRTFNLELRELVERYLEVQQLMTIIRSRIVQDLGGRQEDIDVTLATVGSDGRLEKCLPSLYEVVAYIRRSHDGIHAALHEDITEDISDITDQYAVHRTLKTDTTDPLMKTGLFSEVEVKPFSSPHFLAFHGNPELKAWPSRIMDALPLGPDQAGLIPEAKRRLLTELQGDGGKKLVELENQRHKDARNILSGGGTDRFKGQTIEHFNMDKRELYYNGETGAAALKHGPLRSVQTLCYWKLLQALRMSENGDPLLQGTPTPTNEKIAYLADEGVLKFGSERKVDELRALYDYMVWQQHQAGYRYHVHGEKEILLEQNQAAELQENMEALDRQVREVAKKPGS